MTTTYSFMGLCGGSMVGHRSVHTFQRFLPNNNYWNETNKILARYLNTIIPETNGNIPCGIAHIILSNVMGNIASEPAIQQRIQQVRHQAIILRVPQMRLYFPEVQRPRVSIAPYRPQLVTRCLSNFGDSPQICGPSVLLSLRSFIDTKVPQNTDPSQPRHLR